MNGLALEDVEKFIYLGATVRKLGGGEEDIKARLGKAREHLRSYIDYGTPAVCRGRQRSGCTKHR